jgi:hypothetical protein
LLGIAPADVALAQVQIIDAESEGLIPELSSGSALFRARTMETSSREFAPEQRTPSIIRLMNVFQNGDMHVDWL